MMLCRNLDAIYTLSRFLVFSLHLCQSHRVSRSTHHKMLGRIDAFLVICCALCSTHLDENVQFMKRGRHNKQYFKIVKGSDNALDA